MSMNAFWILTAQIGCWEYTEQALQDFLALVLPPGYSRLQVLLTDNSAGSDEQADVEARRRALQVARTCEGWGLHVWTPEPAQTLCATWNTQLRAAWLSGADCALVVNNDVRVPRYLASHLWQIQRATKALLVTPVNVGEAYQHDAPIGMLDLPQLLHTPRGGPDYSCFLITRECHEKYPFDDRFTYYGDNDHHERIKAAGEGERVFGLPIPYQHFGSKTIHRSEAAREKGQAHFDQCQKLYLEKWGKLP